MKNYALIGCPLGHSMSPIIHKELFLSNNENATYELIEIGKKDLYSSFNELKKLNGFNVTIPHKIDVIKNLDMLSQRAELFGAVNKVHNDNGKLVGYNTDCHGFLRGLQLADIVLTGKVLILGCGGVARMFAFESVLANCDVTLAVRESSLDKANNLKNEIKEKLNYNVNVVNIDTVGGNWDLIINGTPVGMYPNTLVSPVKREVVESSSAVFDAIYNPKSTLLLDYAKKANIKYSNGLSMLVLQAAVSQEIWYGAKFSNEDIIKVIEITQRELDK